MMMSIKHRCTGFEESFSKAFYNRFCVQVMINCFYMTDGLITWLIALVLFFTTWLRLRHRLVINFIACVIISHISIDWPENVLVSYCVVIISNVTHNWVILPCLHCSLSSKIVLQAILTEPFC